jgi:hypothetical protein
VESLGDRNLCHLRVTVRWGAYGFDCRLKVEGEGLENHVSHERLSGLYAPWSLSGLSGLSGPSGPEDLLNLSRPSGHADALPNQDLVRLNEVLPLVLLLVVA